MPSIKQSTPTQIEAHLRPRSNHVAGNGTPFAPKRPTKALWLKTITNSGQTSNGASLSARKLKTVCMEHNHSHANSLALKILFSGHLIEAMIKLKNMPEKTLEQQIAKENNFRNIVLQQYSIREVIADNNCGLRAIVSALHPELDPGSEQITAFILRGDIIQHILTHPESFAKHSNTRNLRDPMLLEAALMEYKEKMIESGAPIGELEMKITSEILETPIRVVSYLKPRIGAKNHILAGANNSYGNQYKKEPVSIYYDPIRNQYFPMEKLQS